ncbi:MAG: hypothetical protein ABJG68_15835 [Crocinitomicaceae bacterium]
MSDELIDNGSISEHTVDLTYKNGLSFTGNTRLLGFIVILMGPIAIFTGDVAGLVIGPVLVLGGGFVLTSQYGTDICLSNKYVREYNKVFFIKTGKWRTTAPYTDICITKIGKTQTRADMTGAVSTEIDVSKNEVYLFTSDHRKRFLLKVCKSAKEAAKIADELAEKLDKKVAIFSPKLSSATKARLQRRR